MADILLALRRLRHDAGFSAIVLITLAVAIGANTAMFTVYDRLIRRPVTLPEPETLVAVWFNNPQRNVQSPSISVPRYNELRAATTQFASLGLSAFDSFTLTGAGDAVQLNGLRVDADFLRTLGVLPARGRNFRAEEDVPNGPAVCILSHELWMSRFGGRESLLGERITLNGTSWEVVGVMPARLSIPFGQVQVFTPRVFETGGLTAQQIQMGATFAQAIGRLAPGASLERVRADLASFSDGYRQRHPASIDANNVSEPRFFVESLVSGLAPTMYTLLGAVACVLLIACANVSALFLARLLRRQTEIAVRLSIGASRGHIIRQCLIETLVIAAAAGACGMLIAAGALRALQALIATQVPPNTELTLNWTTLAFAVAVTIGTSLLIGLLPSLQASRASLTSVLNDAARGSSSGRGGRLRQGLIVAEVSLSVVLLVSAVLLLVSFVRLQREAPGFEARGVASAFVGLTADRYQSPAAQTEFFDRVEEELRARPGVVDTAVAFGLPLSGTARTSYGVVGQPLPPLPERPLTSFNMVSEDYFRVLSVPLVEGRAFTTDDRAGGPRVCVINETLARKLFAGRSPIGQSLIIGRDGTPPVAIVGVIRDVKSAGVNQPTPDEVYVPARQLPRIGLNVVARTTGDANALQAAIGSAVAAVDPAQAIAFFATMETTLSQSLGTQQLVAALTAIFGAVAFGLSLTGLYSVLAYFVSQRTPEIGIRMALGASRRRVVAMVMRSGLLLVAIGLAVGLAASAAAASLIRQLLFGIDPLNAMVYAAVATIFAAIAALACLGPSLRASRIDPVKAIAR
ncbi:MAG TPA: ABC transporter permease [Vicinamibacterales bacterium]|nr:ABC transporter permease [Vicinamibacterales bacterium]